jgi:hypothetical protein
MNFNEIRARLINIYDKISNQSTLQVGLELFRILIKDSFNTKDKCLFIIKEVGDYTKKLNGVEKKEALILIPIFFQNPHSINYLLKILSILSDNINHTTESIYEFIAKIFGEIVVHVNNYDNRNENNDSINDNLFIEFCFELLSYNSTKYYNLKDLDLKRCHQICGNLMLYQYINNSINILTDQNLIEKISNVLTNHFSILNKKGYYAKNELLKCLLILLIKVKKQYSPFANETLKKILLYINHCKDFNIEQKMKKNLLDLIYNLIYFNKEEVQEYIDDVIFYVKLEKVDKNKDVRMIAINILNLLNEEVINYDRNNLPNTLSESKKSQNEFMNLIKNDKLKKGKKEFILVEKKIKHDNSFDEEESKNDNKNINFNNNDNYNLQKKNLNKNLDDINEEMNNIEKKNNELFSTVDNLQNFLNQNYNLINNKLEQLKDIDLNNYQSNNLKMPNKNLNNIEIDNNSNLNNQIKNLLLKDNDLIDYISNIPEDEIKDISAQNVEDIGRRLILFYSINKNNQKNLYKNIIQKLLDLRYNSLPESFLILTKNILAN